MATSGMLDEAFGSLRKIKGNLVQQAETIVAEVQDIILDYNRDRLYKGENAQGQKIRPNYSRVKYARAKNQMNPLPGLGTPDLKVTGRFYAEFYLTANNGKFEIFSSDEKAKVLKAKYGDIFGLTVEDERIVNFDEIYPRLLKWILMNLSI